MVRLPGPLPGDSLALVTGCPGWLGNRFLHYLRHPHGDYPQGMSQPRFDRVRCLVQTDAYASALREIVPDVEIVEGDVRDPGALGRFCADAEGATVFHLAGLIHPQRIRELYEVNTEGTRHLIAAAAAAGVRRVVAVSSNSPAGVSKDPRTVFDETAPYRPYLNYGRSKKLMEDALNSAHRTGAVETVVIRPCWFYGPEQPPRQTLFFRMVKEGKFPIVGNGEARRSMSYVDNVALGLLLASASPEAAGETYWIADERPYSMNEIVDTVEDVLETDFGLEVAKKRTKLPSLVSETAYLVDAAIQRTGLYNQKIHVLSEMNKTIACTSRKAHDMLGYRPSIELREGMRRSVEWCLANGHSI